MNEEQICALWESQLIRGKVFKLLDGRKVKIIDPGFRNNDAGPDFSNGIVIIDHIRWCGNIEIHVRERDWFYHGHQKDPAYQRIILHVVYREDENYSNGFATLELSQYFSKTTITNLLIKPFVKCQLYINKVEADYIEKWLDILNEQRLSRKTKEVLLTLTYCGRSWRQTIFSVFCRAIGGYVNRDAFEYLGRELPISVVLKHRNSLLDTNSLLYGLTNLLSVSGFEQERLTNRFMLLSRKYNLKSISNLELKNHRIRPKSRPHKRLEYLVRIISDLDILFQLILIEMPVLSELKLDQWVKDDIGRIKEKLSAYKIPKALIFLIIINAITPLRIAYWGRNFEQDINLFVKCNLKNIETEDNKIVKSWQKIRYFGTSARVSQALLELHIEFCSKDRCRECAIGKII